ncbi:MAG: tetratricopeptide repeat protein [Myxococcales bacterium]|nr:tetratricopeptide repeat protein [Myxococcales bacterium]MCB9534238.1 tetratricopeptide repeat protein [Myxococcales bacterium]
MSNPVQQYFAALNANPDDAEAFEGLDAVLTAERAWTDIEHMLPKFARKASSADIRARFLSRAAYVARQMNGSAAVADELVAEVLQLDMEGAMLVAAVRGGFEPHADWRGLIAILIELADNARDDRTRARLYHALGRVYEDKLYERERAITCYQRAFKLDPMFTDPLRAARLVYAYADQWATVAKLYQIELRVTEDRREQARLLKELGHIELERLGDREKGVATLKQAAELDPDLSGVVAAIADIEADKEAHGVIVSPRIMQSSAAAAVVPDVVPRAAAAEAGAEPPLDASVPVVDVDIAPVTGAHVAVDEGVDAGSEERDGGADDEVAGDAAAAPEVETVADDDEASASETVEEPLASETSESVFDAAEEPADASDASGDTPAEDADEAEASDADEAAEAEVGSGEGELDGGDLGVETAEAEGDEEAADADASAEGVTSDAPHFADAAPDTISDADGDGPAEAAADSDEVGGSAELEADSDEAGASDSDSSPGDGVEVAAAPDADDGSSEAEVAETGAVETEVAETGAVETEGEPDEAAAAPAAAVAASPAAAPAPSRTAAAAARPAFVIPPREPREGGAPRPVAVSPDAMDAAVARARQSSDGDAWSWVLELGLRSGEAADTLATWFAEGVEAVADRFDAARQLLAPVFGREDILELAFERLFELDESDPDGGFAGAAYAVAFYGLGRHADAAVFAPRAGAVAAADAEAAEVAQKGNWRKAQLALSEPFNGRAGVDAEAEGYRSQAYLALGLGKEDKAADSLRRVLRSNKNDVSALALAATLYRRDAKWAQLADTLKAMVALVDASDVVRVGTYWRDMVELFRDELNQQTNVLAAYKALLEVDPRDLETIDAYGALLDEMNRPQELVHVLRMKADAIDDLDAQVAIHSEVAALFLDRFSNQAEAIASYETVLSLEPENMSALVALEDLYGKRREWEKLIATKRQLVAQSSDTAASVARLRECADIAATRMRDQAASIALWDEVLALDPNDGVALEQLERLFERDKDWEKLADVLGRRVYVIDGDEERAAALLKLGQVQYDRLGRLEDAVATYEDLLSIDPENFRAKDSVKKAYIELEQWDKLAEFYERSGAWAEYVRQLESLVGTVKEPATQVELLFRAADVWSERLDDAARATKSLERVLTIDEKNHDAAVRLAPVYEERQDFKRLPVLLEVILDREEEPSARFGHMVKLARIADERQRDHARAFHWYGAALDELPNHVEIVPELEAAARATGQWSALERHLVDARSRLSGDPTTATEWLEVSRTLGRVYDQQLDDADSALACFDEVLAVAPSDATALDAKDGIYSRLERWDDLLEVIESKAIEAQDDAARIDLFGRIAAIHESQRDDIDAAVRAHEEVLGLDPAHVPAYEALHRLHQRSGDHAALAEVLRRLIALRGDRGELAARRELRLELARVCVDALAEPAAAVEVLQSVVSEAPQDPRARELLEQLLGDEDERLAVARTLEPLYEADRQWERLVDVLEIQLGFADDDADAVALLSRIGDLQRDRLGSQSEAADAYARLLRRAPGETSARERLEAIASASGKWDDVVELYESILSQLDPGVPAERELAVEYGGRAARLFDERLAQPEEAIRVHRRVLDVEPGRPATLLALDALYTRTEAWHDLLGVIEERLLATSEPAERRSLHVQAAGVWERDLGEPAEAIGEHRKVLDLFPDDQAALEALDGLYGVTGDPSARGEIIQQRVALAGAGSPAGLELKNRLARLYQDELGDVPVAMDLWREILAVDASNAAAFEGLETQLEGDDFAMGAAAILEPLYVSQALSAPLVRLLEIRLLHVTSPGERLDLYMRIAQLHERDLRDPAAAYAVLLRGAEEFLGERPILDGLTRLASQLSCFGTLGDALQQLGDDASDPQLRRDTLALVARIREDRVGDHEAAAGLWRQVLEDQPEDREALDALERLDEQLQAWAELVDVLLRKAELPAIAAATSESKPLMFRAATIHEEMLEQPDEAVEVLRRVLAIDPADRHAIGELERLFTQTARWEDLVENYERKLALAGSDDERRDLQFTLGAVLETELDDPDRAIGAYRAVLDAFPTDLEALQALDRLFLQTENWYELLEVLRREIDLVDSDDQRRNVQYRVARLLENELGDARGAVDVYQSILADDPSHRSTRAALQAMITRGDEPVAAASLLEPIYRTEGLWHDLVSINRTLIENADTVERRHELYVDIARIMEHELADANGAIEALSLAAQEEPRAEDMAELERLAPITGAWEQVAALFVELWDDASDPAVRSELGARVARIRERELSDVGGAIRAFVRLHDEDPGAQAALESLDRLYARTTQWEPLAEIIQKRIMLGGAANDAVELRLRLGNVYFEFLEDAVEAVSAYRQVLVESPQNATATARLEAMIEAGVETYEIASILDPLYRETGEWKKLVGLNQTLIHTEVSADERYRIWLDTAEVQEQRLGDVGEALNALGNALFERPSDDQLKDRIEALGAQIGQWPVVADVYAMLLEQDLADGDRLDVAIRLARALTGPLGDDERAEVAFKLALDVEPGNVEALRALDGMYSAQSRWPELVDVVGRLREAVYDPQEMIALATRHATLYRDQLGDAPKAIATFHEVLESDPSSRGALDALVALYTQAGQWAELFDTYERISMLVTTEAERTDVTVKMATLATDALDRPNDAIDLWQSVLGARPTDRQALANLAALFERTEQFDDLARVLDRQIENEREPTAREALLRRAGSLWAEVLDNPDQAIARWTAVLELRPGDAGALIALRGLYETVGDHERLADALEQLLLIGVIAEDDEADVYEQLGALYADTLMRPAEAIGAWREVAARRPSDEGALDRLEELYVQQAQWEPSVAIVERKVELARTDEDRIELLKRIATVWHDRLSNPEQAAAAYERVLELDLSDFDATSNLESIYTRTEAWAPLAALCVDRLEVVEDPWERVQLLRRAADLYENRLEQAEAAFLILAKATQESPSDDELRGELERLADVSGSHEVLVQTYDAIAGRMVAADDEQGALPFLMAIGQVLEGRLGRLQDAERYYERALTIDPEHEPALAALEGVFTASESWASLIGVLKRRVNLTYDVRDQVACHKRIGKLFEEQLDDPTEAVESYKMVVRLDDTDVEALSALERIYESSGQWRELVEVLGRKAESTYEPAAIVPLHFRIGELWQGRLGQPERAVAAFNEVLSHDPGHRGALSALEMLYAGLDKWDRFLGVLDAQLALAKSSEERIDIFAKQALVYEQRFDDVDAAVGAHLNILSIDPKDLEAITSLERIFTDQERFSELLETFERHVHATTDVAEKTDVLCRMAQVQVEQMDDAYSALETYKRVLELDPRHIDALARSGALYENVEQHREAVSAYERLAGAIADASTQLRLVFRAGQLLADPIGDTAAARLRFERCLEIDPDFGPAMEALERIHTESGDWARALSMIQAQIDIARDLQTRSALMVRMGQIHERELGETKRAQQLYEEAIELEPSNVAAARPLAAMFFEQQEWARARPLLQLQLRGAAELGDDELRDLHLTAGVCNEQLGFEPDAVKHYEHVLDHDSSNIGALRGLARLYSRLGRSDAAYQTYIELLAQHGASMPPAEAVGAYVAAGEIKLGTGDEREARHLFLNALELQPDHPGALRQLLGIVERSGNVRDIVDVKRRVLPTVSDALERFKLLVDIGDSYLGLEDVGAAEEAYREAVRIDPRSKVVLHKLLNIFTDTGNWRRATEVLGQLASMEEDPERLAKLCFTIAAIFRDELGEAGDAVNFFNQALDAKFDYLQAFEAIDHLLTSSRDWKALEQNYRRMLGRVEAEGGRDSVDLKVTLLKNLGEIYRSRLQQPEDAIAAYKVASQLAPDDEALLAILTDLLQRGGGSAQDLIVQHQRLIAVSPFRIESYRALFKTYFTERQYDEAWCMAAALTLLQKASPDETKYYERYLHPNVLEARSELTLDVWTQRLYHPDLDPQISNLFGLLAVHLRPHFKRDPKDWGLNKRRDRLDLEQQMPLTKMASYCASRIGLTEVAVYEKQDHYGLTNMNCDPPSLLAGKDMLSGKAQRELAFQVAKAVTLLRPEFYLASAYPSSEHLKTFFLAAYAASTNQLVGEGNAQLITSYAQVIQELPPPVLVQIQRALQAIIQTGKSPDLSAWLRAVDHTANRVGLLLCGDLRTAITAMKVETDREQSISKADIKDKVRELILFNISDPYFALRRDLGLALAAK